MDREEIQDHIIGLELVFLVYARENNVSKADLATIMGILVGTLLSVTAGE